MEQARAVGLIERIKVERTKKEMTHLQYVNDTILLASFKEGNLINLRILLRLLEAVTGLKVNLAKSVILGINIHTNLK